MSKVNYAQLGLEALGNKNYGKDQKELPIWETTELRRLFTVIPIDFGDSTNHYLPAVYLVLSLARPIDGYMMFNIQFLLSRLGESADSEEAVKGIQEALIGLGFFGIIELRDYFKYTVDQPIYTYFGDTNSVIDRFQLGIRKYHEPQRAGDRRRKYGTIMSTDIIAYRPFAEIYSKLVSPISFAEYLYLLTQIRVSLKLDYLYPGEYMSSVTRLDLQEATLCRKLEMTPQLLRDFLYTLQAVHVFKTEIMAEKNVKVRRGRAAKRAKVIYSVYDYEEDEAIEIPEEFAYRLASKGIDFAGVTYEAEKPPEEIPEEAPVEEIVQEAPAEEEEAEGMEWIENEYTW